MKARRELFNHKKVYDTLGSNNLFIEAVRENVQWHYKNCLEYREILDHQSFHPDMLASYEDLYKLPPIPTLYLKSHPLLSIPTKKLRFKSTTSGTSGRPVEIGFNTGDLWLGAKMLRNVLIHHKLFSVRPTNYLILGYEPSKDNQMGAVRTAHGATFLAPALHKEYALVYRNGKYKLNIDGILKKLVAYGQSNSPVRILGFPAYFYFLLKKLDKENITLELPKHSMVLLGGGWKQFREQQVPRHRLYDLANKRLGMNNNQFKEFFGVVEHNVPYFHCNNHYFHVPIYSRVMIRDFRTMAPLGYDKVGMLNLITPLLDSMPLVSIMTDDIAILHEGKHCSCGNDAPFFEIIDRAGLEGITTCAAGAGSILEGVSL